MYINNIPYKDQAVFSKSSCIKIVNITKEADVCTLTENTDCSKTLKKSQYFRNGNDLEAI